MTTDALLAIFLNVLLPGITAVLGGILAVRSLGNAKPVERWSWVSVFVGIGLAGIVFGVVQQIRLTTQQKIAESDAAKDRLQASNEVKYTQGELDAIKAVLQVFAQNTDPSKQAQLFRSFAQSFKLPTPQPAPSAPVVTNAQLKASALDLARRLRELQQILDTQNATEDRTYRNNPAEIPPSFRDQQLSLFAPLRVEAQQMKTVLLNRLPPQRVDNYANSVLDYNALTGPDPLSQVANYLERLAIQLDVR
jgi:hypothetical protein